MRSILLVVVVVIDLLANLPYLRDSLRGKTKPNIATWSTWTLLNIIIITSALSAGGSINTVLLGASYLVGSLSILAIAIFHGTRKYSLFDGLCQLIAILGVVLWQVANNPDIALAFVILVDIFALLPTIRHAYSHPYEETWLTFAIAGVGALGLTCLATSWKFSALAIPIESTIANTVLAGLILFRQRAYRSVTDVVSNS